MRRTLGRVAERGCGQLPAAVDQMLRRIDSVAMTVGEACRGLADAGPVGPVDRAARDPRQQRALELLLQIENPVVALACQRARGMPRLRAR